jgi:ribosomal protein S18 acetylase RimI-like enzyme
VARKVVALNLDTLDQLPAPCRRCVFWELGVKARPIGSEEAGFQKEAWLSSIVLEWGSAGQVLFVGGEPAAYSLYAPARFLEQANSQAARPVSRDAVLLATLAVAPEFEGQGIGRVLLQSMARDLIKRKVRAIEAFGDRVWTARKCHIPIDFLESCGFQVVREHPRYPLLRMDLRTALRWKDAREAALEALRVPAKPVLRPVPSSPRRDRPETTNPASL